MKRIASFALAVLLILSLCACSLPQAKPAKEPIDELKLVEEAAEAAEAEAPEERPIMPEETAPEETEPAAEAAAEGAEMPDPVLPEEPAAPEEAPIPDAPSEVQPENAEAAEMPEPEQEAPSGNGTAPAGDTSGSSGQDSSGRSVTIPEPETGGDLVWIPTHGGTKYHRSASCSNMIDPIQVSRETAIANGFTACKRCY